jgi:uncharacterized protein YkwD
MKRLTVFCAAVLLMGCAASGAADRSASPAAAQARCDLPSFSAAVLQRVNAARTAGADCGAAGRFGSAPPLRWQVQLATAAEAHAQDMAAVGEISHTGSDGRTVRERIDAAGYAWSAIGENVAAGEPTVERAIGGWLASPAHCANILNPAFKDIGVACVVGAPSKPYRSYWAMKLAAPR